jgi:hypothetical protein
MLTRIDADAMLFLALVQVCERSFFTMVEACDPGQFAALLKNVASEAALDAKDQGRGFPWLKATVAFDGTLSKGAVDVFLPERLGGWLVESMLGLDPDAADTAATMTEAQTFDGVGEFANMICGAWLTHMCGSLPFELTAPVVCRLRHGWNPLTDISNPDETQQLASINELPMRIVVHVGKEDKD